jgi:hypothetical protein
MLLSGPLFLKLWSAGSFEKKNIARIVSDTEEMKNLPMDVCAETAFLC